MKASFRCLQELSCVLCSEPHESCQLQLILNFYYPCKYYPKSRSLNSTLSSFQTLHTANAYVSQLLCLFLSGAPTDSLCFFQVLQSKIYISLNSRLFPSGNPIEILRLSAETLRLSAHLCPPFRCSN
jgi:hypothetical protein